MSDTTAFEALSSRNAAFKQTSSISVYCSLDCRGSHAVIVPSNLYFRLQVAQGLFRGWAKVVKGYLTEYQLPEFETDDEPKELSEVIADYYEGKVMPFDTFA